MKKMICTLCLVLSASTSFADGVKMTQKTAKACKGTALNKSIEFFIASESAAKNFERETSWKGKKLYLGKNPSLTYRDIERLDVPAIESGQKNFSLFFNPEGTKKITTVGNQNSNKYLVIMVDGQVGLSAAIQSELGSQISISDSMQSDGKSLFNKMCPVPNVFITLTPPPEPPAEEKPATDDKTKSADPAAAAAQTPEPAKK